MGDVLAVRLAGETHTYPLDGPVTIGRSVDNAITLDSHEVSRRHASLAPGGAGWVFIDLGSANGSRVRGAEVEPRVPVTLRPGDWVEVGPYRIEIVPSSAPSQVIGAPPRDEETSVWPGMPTGAQAPAASPPPAPPGLAPPPAPRAPIGAPSPLTRPEASGYSPNAGQTQVLRAAPRLSVTTRAGTFEFPLRADVVSLGREPGNDIVVESDVVSRRHMVLRREGGRYLAEDLGSSNGFRVGGQRVPRYVLTEGDVLDIAGEVTLRYLETVADIAGIEERHVQLEGKREVVIGRSEDCDMRLAHPTVSHHHARLRRDGATQSVEDLGSTNGTFVNGQKLVPGERRVLRPGDIIRVGPVRLVIGLGQQVVQEDDGARIGLTAVGVNQRVSDSLNLLQNLSFVIHPHEFVAVVGVSGAGKSTLLGALSGLKPASDGEVLLNGSSLYENFDAFRTSLGYVPQDDILHRELPVGRALSYAAELRLPDDTPGDERRTRVDTVIGQLGLAERRTTPVGKLSGGQRKRVSIGAELLTSPGLFFLDEATSGLDPGTESQLMRLLRGLADEGHTIVLITHATKNVMLCDTVLFLAKGGHLAYFGPPDQALTYFGVEDFDGIYEKLEGESTPADWGAQYKRSRQYQEFVAGRLADQGISISDVGQPSAPPEPTTRPARGRSSSAFRQFRILAARYFDIIRRDRVNMAMLFLLAPILGLVDFIWGRKVFSFEDGDSSNAMTSLFLSALVPFLLGALIFVREIVKEAAIYTRERAVSLGIWPYLGSKLAVAFLFTLYHAAAFFLMKLGGVELPGLTGEQYFQLYGTLVLAVMSGVVWALLISTLTSKEEQAMMLVIGIIVLQVVFSGGLLNLDGLGPVGLVLGSITSTGWSFKALTAATGITTNGCTGDLATCDLPGMGALPDAGQRQLTYNGVFDKFGPVFNQDVYVCWAWMVGIIVVLCLILFVLQKRKDTL